MHSFRYILRYKIDPDFHPAERLEELVALCHQGRIQEVMLFITAEELSVGHPTGSEIEKYTVLAREVKRRLAEEGIALSLNPWTTTYHVSRGRTLREGQDFRCIVGETGATSPIGACPLCPNWQDYLCRSFAYLALEVQPTALWVEDDWRIHNHEPDQGWGGCFCPEHLRLFSERVGETVDRETLVQTITAPGEPHPWRREWLALSRETLLQPARQLRAAVEAVAPAVRLGLMTSNPDIHSAEGRDWPLLQEALGKDPFLCRPHVEPYTERPAIDTPPSMARFTIANLHGPIDIYPELESSPRGGVYSKSATFSLWECFNAAVYGSRGITINHFDMMGTGQGVDPGFAPALGRARPQLDALVDLQIDDREAEGVQILFHPEIAAAMPSTAPGSLFGISHFSQIWARTLAVLGIAHGFTREPRPGQLHAVNGHTLHAFDDAQVRQLLSGPLLLDAYSVEILCQRGFGAQIGIGSGRWRQQTEAVYAYESICQDEPAPYGLPRPRMTAQCCSHRLLQMVPVPSAVVSSTIHRPDHQLLFPGSVSFRNEWGGEVLSLAYPFDGGANFFMSFFNPYRRIFLQDQVLSMGGGSGQAAIADHPMHAYRMRCARGTLFAAFNVILDPAEQVVLRLPPGEAASTVGKWQVLAPSGAWETAPIVISGDQVLLAQPLPVLQGAFLLLATNR